MKHPLTYFYHNEFSVFRSKLFNPLETKNGKGKAYSLAERGELKTVIVDTTIMEKAIAFPTASRLYFKALASSALSTPRLKDACVAKRMFETER